MSSTTNEPGRSTMAMMPSDPSMENGSEQDSSASVAIELLGGATIDQALPEKKKTIPDSVLMLLLVVTVAGGGLFVMRKMGLGSQIQFTNVKIDYPLDGVGAAGGESELLNDLRNNSVAQVPLDQVQKNPFELINDEHVIEDRPVTFSGESPEEARLRKMREDRERLLVRTYTALDLNSVLLGSTPVARISGQTVRVGDMVEGIFLVRSISARQVALEADGKMYTLSLGE